MATKPRTKESAKQDRKPARQRIADVAARLFYEKGIHAVGVEEIVREAGVAKISLYRSFSSKDELVVAYLEDLRTKFWKQWDETFAQHDGDPKAQVRAIMTYLAEWTTRPGYRGCPFINYCAEYPDHAHEGHRVAETTMTEMRQRFFVIAEALKVPRPQQLADGILLLVEGAYAISQILSGKAGPGHAIIWAAEALVDSQLREKKSNAKAQTRRSDPHVR